MSRFFESIKVDKGRVWNLEYHTQRVVGTIRDAYRTPPGWDLAEAIASSRIPDRGLFKCRVVFDQHKCSIEFEPYAIRPINTLRLVNADDIVYSHKYVDRMAIDRLFDMRKACDDVLIVKRGRIADSSVANIILVDDREKWWTPSDCLLKGTMRQSLLDSGRIFERSIGVPDLQHFKKFKLINAMRDWDSPGADVSNIIE